MHSNAIRLLIVGAALVSARGIDMHSHDDHVERRSADLDIDYDNLISQIQHGLASVSHPGIVDGQFTYSAMTTPGKLHHPVPVATTSRSTTPAPTITSSSGSASRKGLVTIPGFTFTGFKIGSKTVPGFSFAPVTVPGIARPTRRVGTSPSGKEVLAARSDAPMPAGVQLPRRNVLVSRSDGDLDDTASNLLDRINHLGSADIPNTTPAVPATTTSTHHTSTTTHHKHKQQQQRDVELDDTDDKIASLIAQISADSTAYAAPSATTTSEHHEHHEQHEHDGNVAKRDVDDEGDDDEDDDSDDDDDDDDDDE